MEESARKQRNQSRLGELHVVFRARIRALIQDLEGQGFRPRIQDAWRSPKAQLEAFNSGHSKLRFGFHNVTGPGGTPESLAVDLLDDDNPVSPRREYLLRVAASAQSRKLISGIRWGLPAALQDAINQAIASGDFRAPVKVGWDPCHVEPTDVSVTQAKEGGRPG